MSKLGAVAILAMATFVSAQDCAGDFSTGDSQCHGMDDNLKRVCCEGLECQKKDDWYGQCRAIGSDIPDGWDGTILNYGGENAGGDGTDGSGDGNDMDDNMNGDDNMGGEDTSDDNMGETDIGGEDMGDGDMMAAGPSGAVGEVMYMAVAGKDYIPSMDPATPNLVGIEDIPLAQGAKVVADRMECEDMCTATEGCNAASYYNEAVAGFNCWLKIIDDVCEVPSDALDDPNATLLLKFDDACLDEAMAPMGMDGMAPAAAPMSADEEVVDEETRDFDAATDGGTTSTPVVDDDTDGSILSVRGAAIAMAVAGAAAFL